MFRFLKKFFIEVWLIYNVVYVQIFKNYLFIYVFI